MQRQIKGIACILFGILFSLPLVWADGAATNGAIFYYGGLGFGIVGLILAFSGHKEK